MCKSVVRLVWLCIVLWTLQCIALTIAGRRKRLSRGFEASGILEQIIWCSTVPVRLVESDTESVAVRELGSVLKHLETAVGFLAPKFKSDTPCGDTLNAILDDRDGSANMQPEILNRLWSISKLVECMDSSEFKKKAFGTCQSCEKQPEVHGVPLFCCSRCHITHYCSKECQMADWKHHKHRCKKTSNKEEREKTLSFHVAYLKFTEANCKSVIEELGTMLESTGLADGDLAVVVDFMPNEEGVISAFQDPPVFQVVERTLLSDITFTSPLLQPGVIPPLTVFVLRYGGITFFEGFSIEDFRQGLKVGSSID